MTIYHLDKITTPRLIIRPVQLGDEVQINQAINRSLKSLQRWLEFAKDPSLAATKAFVTHRANCWKTQSGKFYAMVIIHQQDNKIIEVHK